MIPLCTDTCEPFLASPRLLLLKHSPRCGVSRWALEEVQQLEREGDVVPIAIVDVVADRALSRAVAERTGVRHQSPQLLYLERGVVRWHLSHGEITTEAVRRRLTGTPDRT
jgi:bacillithiol system protein YtxJ